MGVQPIGQRMADKQNNMKMILIAFSVGSLALPLGAETKSVAESDFSSSEVTSGPWEHIAPGAG